MHTDFKKLFAQKLRALAPNITGPDKIEAVRKLGISRPTIDKYLSGDVVKIDIADKLINYFSRKVNQRLENLRKANVA